MSYKEQAGSVTPSAGYDAFMPRMRLSVPRGDPPSFISCVLFSVLILFFPFFYVFYFILSPHLMDILFYFI
ncbi:hypothetical protein P168DRAFT_117305 [Aspergillus campestris IBT 28561]|uniref:Uncharacterized protein n=1 Tax=Aspergillus campestris (strain IBT 28561) TaxID=1392248 RepID=A0A2I1D9Z2_ASPC2|nr:uncharacterized protein P168DRAFT_117305 [Aspergillus campestris IBT 28561]PKY06689.1 hypothetical protein P168DRAFT_117305 [Aspergillus campestris IBT 28561]